MHDEGVRILRNTENQPFAIFVEQANETVSNDEEEKQQPFDVDEANENDNVSKNTKFTLSQLIQNKIAQFRQSKEGS